MIIHLHISFDHKSPTIGRESGQNRYEDKKWSESIRRHDRRRPPAVRRLSPVCPWLDPPISYRLRQSDGRWQIIDIFYRNAISQIALRRSDFAAALAKGGARALTAHLDILSAKGSF